MYQKERGHCVKMLTLICQLPSFPFTLISYCQNVFQLLSLAVLYIFHVPTSIG